MAINISLNDIIAADFHPEYLISAATVATQGTYIITTKAKKTFEKV